MVSDSDFKPVRKLTFQCWSNLATFSVHLSEPKSGSGSDEDIVKTLGPCCDGDVSGRLLAAADTTTEIPVSIGSRSESESAGGVGDSSNEFRVLREKNEVMAKWAV